MIYLIRHCSTTGQEPEAVLTEAGEQQAEELAAFLKPFGIERIVSSHYRRAVQSIEPFAAQMDISLETDERLRERTLSAEPFDDWQEIVRRTFDDPDFYLPGGESSREATARAAEAFQDALEAGKSTALVSHGNLSALLLKHLGLPFGMEEQTRLTNPDVFRIEPTENGYEITRLWQEQR